MRACSANVELFLPFAVYPLPAYCLSSHATLPLPLPSPPALEPRLLACEPDDGVDADTERNARPARRDHSAIFPPIHRSLLQISPCQRTRLTIPSVPSIPSTTSISSVPYIDPQG